MSSKIVQAVNVMCVRPMDIQNVTPLADGEILFSYGPKEYKWGIKESQNFQGHLTLFFYPRAESIEALANTVDWTTEPHTSYSTKEIGTEEARQTFRELYSIVKEKLYGVDEVLNDIIGDIPF